MPLALPCLVPCLASSYLANQRATSGLNFCSSLVWCHKVTQRVVAALVGMAKPQGMGWSTPG